VKVVCTEINLGWKGLKDRNLALPPRQGPEISSRACLWVSPRHRHHTQSSECRHIKCEHSKNNTQLCCDILHSTSLLPYPSHMTPHPHHHPLCDHPFIPLARAECDDSLPFSGASSIPFCNVLFPAILPHQLFFHPLSLHFAIYFLSTSQPCCSQIHIQGVTGGTDQTSGECSLC